MKTSERKTNLMPMIFGVVLALLVSLTVFADTLLIANRAEAYVDVQKTLKTEQYFDFVSANSAFLNYETDSYFHCCDNDVVICGKDGLTYPYNIGNPYPGSDVFTSFFSHAPYNEVNNSFYIDDLAAYKSINNLSNPADLCGLTSEKAMVINFYIDTKYDLGDVVFDFDNGGDREFVLWKTSDDYQFSYDNHFYIDGNPRWDYTFFKGNLYLNDLQSGNYILYGVRNQSHRLNSISIKTYTEPGTSATPNTDSNASSSSNGDKLSEGINNISNALGIATPIVSGILIIVLVIFVVKIFSRR